MRRWLVVAFVVSTAVTSSAGPLPQTQRSAPPVAPTSQVTRENVILAADRLRADRWYPHPDLETSPSMDLRILTFAVSAPVPALRRVAVRALGWMENPKDIQVIAERVSDQDATVRLAAVKAIAQCLWNQKGEAVTQARIALEGQLFVEPDSGVKGAIYETLGTLRYGENDNLGRIEGLLRSPFMPSPMLPEWLSGLRGLETFTRRNPAYGLDAATIKRVRELATDGVLKVPPPPSPPYPPPFVDPVLQALQVMQNIKDDDVNAIQKAVVYHCPMGPLDCGWQIRLIGLQMLDGGDDTFANAIAAGLHDVVYQVRYEALTKMALNIEKTGTCQPLIDAFDDRDPHVVQHAIELLNPKCTERDDLTARLVQWVNMLTDPLNDDHWQQPVAALKTLVKFDPDVAHKLAKTVAATYKVWQVRMAGVHVANALMDEDMAVRLAAHDPDVPIGFLEANVRTEALKTLRTMNSKALPDAAIAALTESDYQLLITAATLLQNTARHDAVTPLLAALTRLTHTEIGTADPPKDTSREARLAILARLQELGQPDDYLQLALKPYLTDVDPLVASGAADVIATFAGARPVPQPTKRAPIEPAGGELQAELQLPIPCATISLDTNQSIVLQMATSDAPVTAARFLELANQKFYDGTTFYQFEPNSFAIAGSPGSNPYSGADRFMRDEIGLPHIFGAVSLSTRGRDTDDGQFFIDLSDQPGFDHEYTVFARVVVTPVGPDVRSVLDHIMEGTKIQTIRTSKCPGR
jgi:peptidyl-prolyl cis-trans isomerase B (cyclophilin B)